MSTAAILIRPDPPFRRDAVIRGLEACGYEIIPEALERPDKSDVLVAWNRGNVMNRSALRYEAAGAPIIVAENGYLGREWRGGHWYALAREHHNGAGRNLDLGPSRWVSWGIEFAPWRTHGDEIVILAQRGIGERGVREPTNWSLQIARELRGRTKRPVRVRVHPGRDAPKVSLGDDLANAWACVTWGSAAAFHALLMGVPAFYGFPQWIGAGAAMPVSGDIEQPMRGDRVPMFSRLAWSIWSTDEMATGEPFRLLIESERRARVAETVSRSF